MSIPVIPDILPARPARPSAGPVFDVKRVRDDFPILRQKVRGKPLVYLDNAATAQKPLPVLEALGRFYACDNANIHRGVHLLSERATQEYEDARAKVRDFLHAADEREIIFVRGATEGINLVAQSYGRKHVREGDEVLLTTMEHHSNIVPWQMLCEEKGAKLRVAPINDAGELLLDEFEKLLTPRTRIASVVHVSNSLGTVNPIQRIVELAHARGVPVLVDGAQSVMHVPVNVRELGCDFFVFSGHKLFGPTGVGVLYGRETLLEAMPPYQGGGDMIRSVTFEKTTYNSLPYKFEAGTPNIAGGIGLGAAIDYLQGLDWEAVAAHEHDLLTYATAALSEIPGVRLIGTAREKAGVISFVLEGVHPHDVGTVVDLEGVAIRTGHHCTQPLMERFGVPATARASFAFYNTREEVDALVKAIYKVQEVFGMTQELRELYNDMILEHAKSPRNYRALGEGSLHQEGYNPLCGDRVTVYATVENGVVKDVSFQGNGCAVSKASASIMTQLLKGKTLAEAEELYTIFHDLLTGKLDAVAEEERLGKLAAFKDVRKFPVRVKCATLAWHTLHAALHDENKPVSTEE